MSENKDNKTLNNSKLIEVLEKVKKYQISPYEIGNNTTLTVTGVQKILDGETKKPSIKSLNIISEYVSKTYEPENFIQEQKEAYNLNEEVTLAKILITMERIESKLNAYSLKQEIMFEIIKNAKAKELEHLNKEFSTKIKS